MAAILRTFSNKLISNSFTTSMSIVRSISKIDYNDRIKLFEKNREETKKKFKYDEIKSKIENSIKTEQKPSGADLKKLIFLSSKDQDLNIVLKTRPTTDLTETVSCHLFSQYNTDKIIEFLKDKDVIKFFGKSAIKLFEKLYEEKKYNEIINIIESQIDLFKIQDKIGFIRLYTKAALKMNSSEAFEKMKEFLTKEKVLNTKNSFVITNVVLLSLNQKQKEFAKSLLDSINGPKKDVVIENLKSITLSSMNQLNESLDIMEKILSNKQLEMHEFEGKFFKLTLDQFKNSIESYDGAKEDLLKRFINICEKIKNENQLNKIDLYEFSSEYRWTGKNDADKLKKDNSIKANEQNKQKSNSNLSVVGTKVKSSEQKESKKNQQNQTSQTTNTKLPNQANAKSSEELLNLFNKLYEEKKFFAIVNGFEKNFLNLELPERPEITDSHLKLYVNSLININKEAYGRIKGLIEMPIKNNIKFDVASKNYLESLYKEIILSKNHLSDLDVNRIGSNKP